MVEVDHGVIVKLVNPMVDPMVEVDSKYIYSYIGYINRSTMGSRSRSWRSDPSGVVFNTPGTTSFYTEF
jgi:hypothetical protein